MNIKQKVRLKTQQMNIDIFWNLLLLELIDYFHQFVLIKTLKQFSENIIYQKLLSKTIINGKNFYMTKQLILI